MLDETRGPGADDAPTSAPSTGSGAPSPVSLLRTAVRIVEQASHGPLVYVVADDTRARTLFDIVRALSPDATSVHLPASDALPGDDAPSSPANAGQRVAALRQVRKWHEDGETAPLICLTSAEATVQSYAPPAAFTASPPILVSGQSLDLAHFEEECVARGYVIDDRIDEPGEIAIRGSVVDIFPVDATHPVRIEIEEARITAIRTYDPIDQRTLEDVDAVEIGRAREPDTGGGGALLDHFEDCTLIEEAAVAARRKSYLALAKDAARFGRAARGTISDADWAAAARATGQNLFGLAERKQVAPTSPRFQRGLLGRGRDIGIMEADGCAEHFESFRLCHRMPRCHASHSK